MRRIFCVALAATSVAFLAWGSVSAATGISDVFAPTRWRDPAPA
jgi:hypothetical protein